ncbi:putative transcriptional regulator, AraC/XylS family [Bradyrhizobium oligotrophicum S58]|uniref:Putative transcriptional regulator, AraC/XylS family n=1 Tax=Bradyrhizobium oligotrophicum S58 TaxID=1245469 RepID=M4Z6V5_9BRAD|nr:AraC family transcriptional regulator [Bradyrhizobium oligotrophicum]BAM89129.1 putative transcriptional regulator, AraC/XylS family [Bradyrhizobium oligotrophicum S58]
MNRLLTAADIVGASPKPGPTTGSIGLEPLHRYALIRTSNAEVLRDLASRRLGAERIDFRHAERFEAIVNLIELETIGLAFGTTTCDMVSDHRAADYMRVQIAMKGRAVSCARGEATDVSEQQFAVAPAGVPWQMACQGGHRRLTLRLDPQVLRQRLTALVGVQPRADYAIDPAVPAADPQARSLLRLLDFLTTQLNEQDAAFPAAVYRELEDAVHVAFLCASRHRLRDMLLDPAPMPDFGLVKRLEDYIEANWREPITIERLAREAGVSVRSIFRVFERVRGYSPMAFAKSVRLRRAHEMLRSGDPAVTVAAAAAACNFANAGHFARYYRATFGELPSVTMARAERS